MPRARFESKFEYGGDFGSPDETYLSAQFDRPVMVHRYPVKVKAFYMEPDPVRPDLALCVECTRAGKDMARSLADRSVWAAMTIYCNASEHELPEDSFKWYLDLRKFAAFPTAALAWASNVRWRGSVVLNTCARRFHSRAC